MKDVLCSFHGALANLKFGDVSLDPVETTFEMGEVGPMTGGEVVNHPDASAFGE
jgi:hypothetical protein